MNNKALLVSKINSSVNVLKGLLEENSYDVSMVVSDSKSAAEYADDTIYDIVVINSPIEDSSGIDTAISISKNTVCGVVLLVQTDKAGFVGKKVIDYGVIVVPKPINKMLFRQSLGVVRASQKRYAGLSEENERLKSSLEETKIINRAKFLLMQYLALSEERAHKYIEKQA
ncbi:MAG: ANTAR domain-containing protein, partial [Clostridia bacterium]|nr:ANTAR domain-containing protein [Clostridia bacterium]